MRPRLGFLLAALLAPFAIAHATLVAGPERQIAPPAYGPAFGTQYPQALATDGTDVLSIWIDQQPGREGLYAAVVTAQGVTRPLPPRPIVRGYVYFANAVWVGDAYLLVWYDANREGIMAARLNRDGELVAEPVVIAPGQVTPMSMAWNGRHALVVVTRGDGLNAMVLDANGRIIRDDLRIGLHRASSAATVVASGDAFVAVTSSRRRVRVEWDGHGPWCNSMPMVSPSRMSASWRARRPPRRDARSAR